MNNFALIYTDTLNFAQGLVSIANTAMNLSMAYVTISSNLGDNLELPSLHGFLYQVDSEGARSRPYPIISAQQTVRLDLRGCQEFLFIPSNRIIDQYILSLYVQSDTSSNEIDLTGYITFNDFNVLTPSLIGSTLIAQIENDITALQQSITGLSTPDLSAYLPRSALAGYLNDYAFKSDLNTLSNTVSALPPSMSVQSQTELNWSQNQTRTLNAKAILSVSEVLPSIVTPSTFSTSGALYNDPSNYGGHKAFDSNLSMSGVCGLNFGVQPCFLQFDFTSPTALERLEIVHWDGTGSDGNLSSGWTANSFTVQALIGGIWTNCGSLVNKASWVNSEVVNIPLSSVSALSYRLLFTATNSSHILIWEIKTYTPSTIESYQSRTNDYSQVITGNSIVIKKNSANLASKVLIKYL